MWVSSPAILTRVPRDQCCDTALLFLRGPEYHSTSGWCGWRVLRGYGRSLEALTSKWSLIGKMRLWSPASCFPRWRQMLPACVWQTIGKDDMWGSAPTSSDCSEDARRGWPHTRWLSGLNRKKKTKNLGRHTDRRPETVFLTVKSSKTHRMGPEHEATHLPVCSNNSKVVIPQRGSASSAGCPGSRSVLYQTQKRRQGRRVKSWLSRWL